MLLAPFLPADLLVLADKAPGQDRILGDIGVASACYLVEPLEVLVVGYLFVDPESGFLSFKVVADVVLFDLDGGRYSTEEGLSVFEVEVEHDFPAVL